MPLFLVDPYYDVQLALPADDQLEAAMSVQFQRSGRGPMDPFVIRLRAALIESLDWDLRPPTESQATYGIAIAAALTLDLPGECLRYRGAMHEFIQRHAPEFAAHKRRGMSGGEAT